VLFVFLIIRRSSGRLSVLHAFVSCSTLYCALYVFLVMFKTNKMMMVMTMMMGVYLHSSLYLLARDAFIERIVALLP